MSNFCSNLNGDTTSLKRELKPLNRKMINYLEVAEAELVSFVSHEARRHLSEPKAQAPLQDLLGCSAAISACERMGKPWGPAWAQMFGGSRFSIGLTITLLCVVGCWAMLQVLDAKEKKQ